MGLISVIFSSEGAVADVIRGWVSPASTVIAVVIIGVLVHDVGWDNGFVGVVCVLAGRVVWIDGFNCCGDKQGWESIICITAVVGDWWLLRC